MHNVGCLIIYYLLKCLFQNTYALDSAGFDIIMIHEPLNTFIVRTPIFSLKC